MSLRLCGFRQPSDILRLATLTMETEIRFATAEARARSAEELAQAVATLAARYHDEHAPGGRVFKVLAAAHPAPRGARPKGSKP